jgi:hypothetical protein
MAMTPEQRLFFEANGYLALPGALSAEELARVRAAADRAEATWRADPTRYYEDGFEEFARRGGLVGVASIGAVEWVEVDDPEDLARAREVACRC